MEGNGAQFSGQQRVPHDSPEWYRADSENELVQYRGAGRFLVGCGGSIFDPCQAQ